MAEAEDLQHAQQRLQLDQIGEQIGELSGKAVTQADRLALLDLRMTHVAAQLLMAKGEGQIEGKAILQVAEESPEIEQRRFVVALMPILCHPDVLKFNWETGYNVLRRKLEGKLPARTDLDRAAVELWGALLERQGEAA
jgi:hypothetical protein